MEQIKIMLERLSMLELFGIGALLAIIVHIIFLRRHFMRKLKGKRDKK